MLAGHPQVVEAAVIGRPDPQTGDETVLAYVVPRPGGELTEAELLEWAAGSLARFKLPAAVTFVGELPHSATGKVSKARLREAGGPRPSRAVGPVGPRAVSRRTRRAAATTTSGAQPPPW